jgi:hypothetical protein
MWTSWTDPEEILLVSLAAIIHAEGPLELEWWVMETLDTPDLKATVDSPTQPDSQLSIFQPSLCSNRGPMPTTGH